MGGTFGVSLGLRLWSKDVSSGSEDAPHKNNELVTMHDLKKEHQYSSDSYQHVHVDDISELCLDAFVGISEQEPDTSTRQILKECLDRFSKRIRPLYN